MPISRNPIRRNLKKGIWVMENRIIDMPESQLWFHILKCALLDLTLRKTSKNYKSAVYFLNSPRFEECAYRCGLEPDFVRAMLNDAGVKLNPIIYPVAQVSGVQHVSHQA